ncbi:hypothetical protein PV328_010874 [Microctonus aethiopoides]|uniref:Uncharacterized protein n=1 Tax=Microctonus aethiopoides TaxID=144406 RepID=A0AA39FIZ7_9HYME|nr:hypothetical protein PV328_010874 [Microctonus aethiopoides]
MPRADNKRARGYMEVWKFVMKARTESGVSQWRKCAQRADATEKRYIMAKPMSSISKLLQIAITKQPEYVKVKSILSMPIIKSLIQQHKISPSLIDSLDLSKFGLDKPMQKWVKTALKSFTNKHVNN